MLLLFAVSGLSALCSASSAMLGFEKKITIAKKFYEQRKVSAVTALICWDNHEFEFFRAMAAVGIKLSIVRENSSTRVIKNRNADYLYRNGIFVDASCPATRDFLETASQQKLFTILRHWLILDDTPWTRATSENTTATDRGTRISDRAQTLLSDLHALPDSRVTWCQRANAPANAPTDIDTDTDTLYLYEVYKPCIGYPLEATLVGEISVGGNTKMSLLERVSATAGRGDLKGASLKAATVIQFPQQFTTMYDLNTKSWDPWTKIHHPIALYLAKQLNFSLELTTLNNYGWQAPNGSFDGMMGMLQRHEVELTATGIFMRLDRMDLVDFTADTYTIRRKNAPTLSNAARKKLNWGATVITLQEIDTIATNCHHTKQTPFTSSKSCRRSFTSSQHLEHYSFALKWRAAILFRQPQLSSVNNIFLLPFSGSVWLSCVSLCAITFLVLATQIFYSATVCLGGTTKDCTPGHSKEHITVSDVVTYVFCIVCQQGFHTVPNALSARTTVFVVSLASLFLFTSFSANIVALLQTPSAAIQNLVDLMESPLKLFIEDITYNKHYVEESTDAVTQQLIRRKLSGRVSPYLDPFEGMKRIRTGMVAFQVDTTVGYKVISETYTAKEKCGLKEVEMYPLPRFAMATVRGSPYRELLGQRLRWQREAGILDRVRKMWVTQKPICENNLAGFVSVSLIEFYPALAVLCYGFVASLLIFAVEILHFHRMTLLRLFVKPRRRRQRRRRENEMKRAFNKVAAVPIESSVGVGGVDGDARAGLPRMPTLPPWAWTD